MKRLNLNPFNMPFLMKGILLIALAFTVSACEEDTVPTPENLPTKDIMEIVDETANVSTLKAAIDAAGLRSTLEGDGPFTVFAPTDAAFAALEMATPGITAYLLENTDELAKVLTYHVVAAEAKSTDLIAGPYETVNGQNVEVDLSSGVKVNDATVTTADILATNGVIHLIDKVLIPEGLEIPENLNPDGTEKTIADLAIGTESLSTLVAILSLDGLSDILAAASNKDATLTVFAPTNDAFAAVLTALGLTSIDEIPESVLLDIVKYHIVGSVAKSTDLMSQDYPTLYMDAEGTTESVTVDLTSGVKVDNANVVIPDVVGANGVVHVVDAVLLPSFYAGALGTIVEVPLFRKEYSILTSALVKADLVTTLLGDGPFTVFAPNNAAFEAANFGQSVIDVLTKEQLTPVLLYHVLGSQVLSSQIPATSPAAPFKQETLGGDFWFSNQGNGAGVFINGAIEVTGVDIEKSNGVVHTIDGVLEPAFKTIADLATDLGFTKLVEALVEAQLDGVFANPTGGPFTVFAPTNDAFDALYTTLGVDGPAQIDDTILEEVLTYHVLNIASDPVAPIFSTDLEDGLNAPTLQLGTVKVNIKTDGTVTLTDNNSTVAEDDATVISTNVLGTNGVIHAIDAVILPVDL